MKQKPDWIERRRSLRTAAEGVLPGISRAETARPAEVLLHELLVHKVELEMQIEELRSANTSLEEARNRYAFLYDFATVGYVTISRECLISEINLAGAAMLGVDRAELSNCRFSNFVAAPDKDRWHRLFRQTMEHVEKGNQAFILELRRANGSSMFAHLDCQRWQFAAEPAMLRLTLIDIDRIKQAEVDLQDLRLAAIGESIPQGLGGH